MHHPEPQALIEDGSFQRFLNEFGQYPTDRAALKAHGKYPFARELSALMQCYRKAEKKIPSLLQILPALDQKSLEQCTSESVAKYKTQLIKGGKSLLNISGGLGIDEWALSAVFEQITSLDPDVRLNKMVRYNWQKAHLGHRITRMDISAEDYLLQFQETSFDCIYADPDRRSGKSKSDPGEHAPDVFRLMPELLRISPQVWVKFSPLLDTAWLSAQPYVGEIWCLAQQNEMKEVLVKFERKPAGDILYGSVHLKNDGSADEYIHRGNKITLEESQTPVQWIYLPDASMTHSRLSFERAQELGLYCLSKTGQIFGSDTLYPSWQGRTFRQLSHFPFQFKKLQKYVEIEGISGAILLQRGTALRADNLRKKLKLKETGPEILMFGRTSRQEMVFHLREFNKA